MKLSQGCTRNEDKYSEGTREAMSRIIIQQEDERQLETIRLKVSNKAFGGRVEGWCMERSPQAPKNVGITGSVWKHAKLCEGWESSC